MSRTRTATAVLVATAAFTASVANAGFTTINAPVHKTEASVEQIFEATYGGDFSLTGNDFGNGLLTATRVDDADDQSFSGIVLSMKALARFAGYAQTFGVIEDGSFNPLMTTAGFGHGVVGQASGPVDLTGGDFSFARAGGPTVVSANDAFNVDGLDHMISYRLTGNAFATPTYVLFFEDLLGANADRDFNDLAVELTVAGPPAQPLVAVPLPGAALMGLATLAGGAVFGKRIRKAVA